MFNPEEIQKVLGNDEKSQQKLQELLQMLEKQKIPEELDNERNTVTVNNNSKYQLKQKLRMMKAKRMSNNGKASLQNKMQSK